MSAIRPLAVGVVGASGFIGSACAEALQAGSLVTRLQAPRFHTRARTPRDLSASVDARQVAAFAEAHLAGLDVLVNAAGMAAATSSNLDRLVGANAMLPLFLSRAATAAGLARFVHVSSAAVQGRGVLDESDRLEPDNAYALSKALGEALLSDERSIEVVRYRPTSVHGRSRAVTRTLMRVAQTRHATVAAPGDDPSPQMPVSRAAEAVRMLVQVTEPPPRVVLHPWEGSTTRSLLADLGGREPRRVNRALARRVVSAAYAAGRGNPAMRANARRIEMMLFGQAQTAGWLSERLSALPADWITGLRAELLGLGQVRHE